MSTTQRQGSPPVVRTTDSDPGPGRSARNAKARRAGLSLAAAAVVVVAAVGAGYGMVSRDTVAGGAGQPRHLHDDEVLASFTLPAGETLRSLDVVGDTVVAVSRTTLRTLDADTGQVLDQVPAADGEFRGAAVGAEGALWTSFKRGDRHGYIRIAGGRVTAFADVGRSDFLASGAAGLWAVAADNSVVRLDGSNGAVLATVRLPFRPFGLWVDDDAVWAQAVAGGALARIDAATRAVRPGPVLSGSAHGALADGALWVVEPASAQLVQIDVATARELGRTGLPGSSAQAVRDPALHSAEHSPFFVGHAGDSVYVTSVRNGQRLLIRLDTGGGHVVDVLRLPNGSAPVAVAGHPDGDSIWVAPFGAGLVQRLRPAR